MRFNGGQLCADVNFKLAESHFDDINYASIKVSDYEGTLQNKNGKHTRQSNTAQIL